MNTPNPVRTWVRLILLGSVAVTAVDAVLLQRSRSFFTGGFLVPEHLDSAGQIVAFLVVAMFVNAVVGGALFSFAVTLGRRLSEPARALLGICVSTLPLIAADAINYQIWSYLGDAVDLSLLYQLTGRRLPEFIAVAGSKLVMPAAIGAIAIASVGVSVWLTHRRGRRADGSNPGPSAGRTLSAALGLLAIGAVTCGAVAMWAAVFDEGLRRTAAGRMSGALMNRLTDIDGDGYGVLRPPKDTAPFNAAIHPYALDIPGDGVDQDGVAGDLPIARATYTEAPPPPGAWPSRPPVVLITLESVRADAVGATLNGKPVTPVLDALGRRGVAVPRAFSHNGYTAQSLFHILTGSLANLRQDTSILDDFRARGYQVAYFAAGDDTFGGMPVSHRNVDVYYDARQDVARRFSTFTTPGSLAVPFDVLEARVGAFLESRSTTAPLFVYLNLQDTHFPYSHSGLSALVDSTIVPRIDIGPGSSRNVHRMYLNTLANVDAAIGRLLHRVQAAVGSEPGVMVLSDHGESLFDEGFLGHGYALNDVQTQIPLIVANLPLRIAQPFGEADLRDELARAMSALPAGPAVVQPVLDPAPGPRVFQYLGLIGQPGEIAWTGLDGRLIYDFKKDRVKTDAGWVAAATLTPRDAERWRSLVQYWEAMRLAQSRAAQREP